MTKFIGLLIVRMILFALLLIAVVGLIWSIPLDNKLLLIITAAVYGVLLTSVAQKNISFYLATSQFNEKTTATLMTTALFIFSLIFITTCLSLKHSFPNVLVLQLAAPLEKVAYFAIPVDIIFLGFCMLRLHKERHELAVPKTQ